MVALAVSMSTISSRNPEGEPVKCPICGQVFSAIPSQPLQDTTCPSCGSLIVIERQSGFVEVIAIVGPTPATPVHANQPIDDRFTVKEIADITPGKVIRVASGTFAGFIARVKAIDATTGTATIEIPVFGKVTVATVSFADIVGES